MRTSSIDGNTEKSRGRLTYIDVSSTTSAIAMLVTMRKSSIAAGSGTTSKQHDADHANGYAELTELTHHERASFAAALGSATWVCVTGR